MQLSEDNHTSPIKLQEYNDHSIKINDKLYENSVILSPTSVMAWTPRHFSKLALEHIAPLCDNKPELIIVGTGKQFQLVPMAIVKYCHDRKIGIESMDSGAACRTFAALNAEGRNLIAAIILEPADND